MRSTRQQKNVTVLRQVLGTFQVQILKMEIIRIIRVISSFFALANIIFWFIPLLLAWSLPSVEVTYSQSFRFVPFLNQTFISYRSLGHLKELEAHCSKSVNRIEFLNALPEPRFTGKTVHEYKFNASDIGGEFPETKTVSYRILVKPRTQYVVEVFSQGESSAYFPFLNGTRYEVAAGQKIVIKGVAYESRDYTNNPIMHKWELTSESKTLEGFVRITIENNYDLKSVDGHVLKACSNTDQCRLNVDSLKSEDKQPGYILISYDSFQGEQNGFHYNATLSDMAKRWQLVFRISYIAFLIYGIFNLCTNPIFTNLRFFSKKASPKSLQLISNV